MGGVEQELGARKSLRRAERELAGPSTTVGLAGRTGRSRRRTRAGSRRSARPVRSTSGGPPAHLRIAGLGELVPHVDPLAHLERARVDHLEYALALRGVLGGIVGVRCRRSRCWRGRSASRRARSCSRAASPRRDPANDPARACPLSRRSPSPLTHETRSRLPFFEIAMWSARFPSTLVRQRILPVFRLIADHVGEARAREVDVAPVGRRESVVHILVVALADQRRGCPEVELAAFGRP